MATKTTRSKLSGDAKTAKQTELGLTVVSLFAGAGGLDIAACQTGKVGRLFSTDSNGTFLQTVINNIPKHFPKVRHCHLVSDAHAVTGDTVRKAFGVGCIDLVIGGPPCDDFTSAGQKKGALGNKSPLIFQYARMIKEMRPRAFLFENVPNLKRMCGPLFDELQNKLSDLGYSLKTSILEASAFGVPSIRKRIFIAGFDDNEAASSFAFPQATHGASHSQELLFSPKHGIKPFVTVGDVLSDLSDASPLNSGMHLNHTARLHRPETVEHLKSVPQGIAVNRSYRYRAPWLGLCRSLTAGLDDSAKAYIHPIYHREMTVREYARIHGFPDTWEFSGKLDNGLKQVANAVPVPLGCAVLGQLVWTLLKGGDDE